MKKIQITGIVLFSLLLLVCSLATLVLPDRLQSDMENRDLATRPSLSLHSVRSGTFQTNYETYLSDQMLFRDSWVSLASCIEYAEGKKDINNVYMASQGYLIEKTEKNAVDKEQVEENTMYLTDFLNDSAEVLGADHVRCLMVPSKATVLADKLPAYAAYETEDSLIASIKKSLEQPEVFLDLRPILSAHSEEYIFYRTDHHWTTLGAFYAYQALQASLEKKAPEINDYQRESAFADFYGTTYNKAHIPVKQDTVEIFHSKKEQPLSVVRAGENTVDSCYFRDKALQGFNRYDVFFGGNTSRITIDTKAGTGKTLLVLKDSFANCFVPFLTEEYDRIILLDYRYGKQAVSQVVEENNGVTDVLVLYNTDKFKQDTHLHKLDTVEISGKDDDPEDGSEVNHSGEESSIEKFDADAFFNEPDEEEEE